MNPNPMDGDNYLYDQEYIDPQQHIKELEKQLELMRQVTFRVPDICKHGNHTARCALCAHSELLTK